MVRERQPQEGEGRQEVKLTPEQKARMRALALQNLQKEDLMAIASAAYVDSDKAYGDADGDSVDQFVYRPALNGMPTYYDENGEQVPLWDLDPTKSRTRGRYSGRVEATERQILDKAQAISDASVLYATVADLATLMGYKGEIKKELAGQYIADLLTSKNEEAKKVASILVGAYQAYRKDTAVITGLSLKREALKGGLEEILNPSEEGEE